MAKSNEQKCIEAVTKKIQNSEYNTVTMKGVRNLSRADLESVVMYAEFFARGDYSSLMKPVGNVKALLEAFGVKTESEFSYGW